MYLDNTAHSATIITIILLTTDRVLLISYPKHRPERAVTVIGTIWIGACVLNFMHFVESGITEKTVIMLDNNESHVCEIEPRCHDEFTETMGFKFGYTDEIAFEISKFFQRFFKKILI